MVNGKLLIMAKKEIKKNQAKLRTETMPEVQTTDKGIHFSPRFVGQLADEVARTVSRRLVLRRQNNKKKKKPNFKTLIIGIDVPRETLYAKVDARIEKMVKDGLVEEVRSLIKKYPTDLPSLNTIGYKEIIDYLKGQTDLLTAKEKIKTNTHAYIRKQDTWFRRNKDIKWVKNFEEAQKLVEKFVKK